MLTRESSRSAVAAAIAVLALPHASLAQQGLPPPDPPSPPSTAASSGPSIDPKSLETLLAPRSFEAGPAELAVAPMAPPEAELAAQPAAATPTVLASSPPARVQPHAAGVATAPATAGAGSATAPRPFAKADATEVGGAMALTHDSETTAFRLTPAIGYFIANNVEFSLMPEMRVMYIDDHGDGAEDVSIGLALEGSYHVPVERSVFVFGGLGVGARYAKDPGYSTFLRTRLGLDLLVGSSGAFKPAAFLDMGFNDGITAGGLEAGFMLAL
jgi:hypothetical protein